MILYFTLIFIHYYKSCKIILKIYSPLYYLSYLFTIFRIYSIFTFYSFFMFYSFLKYFNYISELYVCIFSIINHIFIEHFLINMFQSCLYYDKHSSPKTRFLILNHCYIKIFNFFNDTFEYKKQIKEIDYSIYLF